MFSRTYENIEKTSEETWSFERVVQVKQHVISRKGARAAQPDLRADPRRHVPDPQVQGAGG